MPVTAADVHNVAFSEARILTAWITDLLDDGLWRLKLDW